MSKARTKELNVDFIGGQGPLSKEEERQISAYLESKKPLRDNKAKRRTKELSKQTKATS